MERQLLFSGHWSSFRQLHVFSGGWEGGGVGVYDFLVALIDDGFHVLGTAVANFYAMFVEYLVESIVLGEVFLYQFEEGSANIGFYILAVWGIVPNDVSLSVASRSCR